MKNATVGTVGAALTGASTIVFAGSMIVGLFTNTVFVSCFASMWIAIGFVLFMAALNASGASERRAAGTAAMCFAAVYAVLVFIVYWAECTTVRMHPELGDAVLSVISYSRLGSLFFNYDLLGYACMALSTCLAGLAFQPKQENGKSGRALKWLLTVHGVFFVSCLFVPLFPVFGPGQSSLVGTVLLEIWCAYFLPVCILGFRHFRHLANAAG